MFKWRCAAEHYPRCCELIARTVKINDKRSFEYSPSSDYVRSSVNYTLGANLANLRLSGTSAIKFVAVCANFTRLAGLIGRGGT